MPTIKDSEGNDIPKPKAQYGDADYKMLGKNAKAKCILVLNDLLYTGVIQESRVEGLSLNRSKMSTPTEEVSIGLKSAIEGVSTRLKHLQSAIEEVSTHKKDLKSAIEEISTHLKESNTPLKMSTPIEDVSTERE
ncbi:hypothetical protein MTR67_013745 [Solanum verrucosum]|uniref:Uncharacterized protein n=1 Tax=Solanum verrucosum TaxID=315347 RepID=A0AAF0QDQ9_SOLVR|nr:hypothetical protein MTR67_013745 [Solanum verrucosum]